MKLANITKTSRVMVNQPQAASNSGNLWNGMRQTFSLDVDHGEEMEQTITFLGEI